MGNATYANDDEGILCLAIFCREVCNSQQLFCCNVGLETFKCLSIPYRITDSDMLILVDRTVQYFWSKL
jgi:hypothetical protein